MSPRLGALIVAELTEWGWQSDETPPACSYLHECVVWLLKLAPIRQQIRARVQESCTVLIPGGRWWLGPGLLAFLAGILCSWSATGRAADEAGGCAPVARVVSLTGSVQLRRAGQNALASVKLGTLLCQNDLLHTDAGSRAALFLSAETLIRLDQNSTVRISQSDFETVVEFTKDAGTSKLLLAPDQC